MVAILRRLTIGKRGLTLLEMAVVGAILSIMAGLTAVAVTGSSTSASASALQSDLTEVQKAVSSYSGQNPRSEYPTLNGCLPGQVKIASACTAQGTPAAWPTSGSQSDINTWLQSSSNWVAVLWDKGYTRQGVTRFFGQDFLGKLPRHAKEHADGTLSPWTRTPLPDPDVSTSTMAVPNCAGAADTNSACTGTAAATNAPVWVLDKTGTARVVITPTSY